MSFLSRLKDLVVTTTFAIRDTSKKVLEKAKLVAAEALLWMADKAEVFVGSVKALWKRIQPSIQSTFWAGKRILESLIPDALLSGIMNVVGLVIDWAFVLQNTVLAQKIDAAISWVIHARTFANRVLSEADSVVARANQNVLEHSLTLVRSTERRTLQLRSLCAGVLISDDASWTVCGRFFGPRFPLVVGRTWLLSLVWRPFSGLQTQFYPSTANRLRCR